MKRVRDMDRGERERGGFVVRWYLGWLGRVDRLPGRESARAFWIEVVKGKAREAWQLEQWKIGIRWYLGWLTLVEKEEGLEVAPSLAQRVHRSVMGAGARRGLALRTRKTYAARCRRFGYECANAGEVMDEERATGWLAG